MHPKKKGIMMQAIVKRLAASLVLFGSIILLPSLAIAQGQQWRVSQADPSQPVLAAVPGNGPIVGMGLACEGAQAFLLIKLSRAPARDPVTSVLTIDGASFSIPLGKFGDPTYLAGSIGEPGFIDALAGGQTVEVQVDRQQLGSLSLAGSSAALTDALAGCWQSPDANFAQADNSPAPEVSPGDRAAIMRAAGFTRSGDDWTTCEGEETGSIEQVSDLNGDGNPEALVMGYGTACHGFGGTGFVLLTQQGNAWRIVDQGSGIPAFFARAGLAWPDLEIGGPGSDCFPFLRWDGQGYVRGGTSIGGEICTLDPKFAAGSPPVASNPGSAAEGILGQVPVRLGYYVYQGERCDRPTYLYKFESDRHLEIFEENGRIDALTYDYARVTGQDDGFYFIELADAGPEDPAEIGIRTYRGGRIDLLIQDIVELVHCQEEQIPSRMRR